MLYSGHLGCGDLLYIQGIVQQLCGWEMLLHKVFEDLNSHVRVVDLTHRHIMKQQLPKLMKLISHYRIAVVPQFYHQQVVLNILQMI